jgi:2-oxoglutarate ferredoxin oxidoreductase subunit delta
MGKPKLKAHLINRDWCKGCGICVQFCPKGVLEIDDKEKAIAHEPTGCVCCKMCELRCPDLALKIELQEE